MCIRYALSGYLYIPILHYSYSILIINLFIMSHCRGVLIFLIDCESNNLNNFIFFWVTQTNHVLVFSLIHGLFFLPCTISLSKERDYGKLVMIKIHIHILYTYIYNTYVHKYIFETRLVHIPHQCVRFNNEFLVFCFVHLIKLYHIYYFFSFSWGDEMLMHLNSEHYSRTESI